MTLTQLVNETHLLSLCCQWHFPSCFFSPSIQLMCTKKALHLWVDIFLPCYLSLSWHDVKMLFGLPAMAVSTRIFRGHYALFCTVKSLAGCCSEIPNHRSADRYRATAHLGPGRTETDQRVASKFTPSEEWFFSMFSSLGFRVMKKSSNQTIHLCVFNSSGATISKNCCTTPSILKVSQFLSSPDFVPLCARCWSYLGRQKNAQPISLQKNGCVFKDIIQHEALHALGFHHEHVRSDRDEHVTINFENIISGQLANRPFYRSGIASHLRAYCFRLAFDISSWIWLAPSPGCKWLPTHCIMDDGYWI